MKKYIYLIILMTVCFCRSWAQESVGGEQGNKEAGGRLEALKIAWLTKKLSLSIEEAQRFWPVYNTYIMEIRKVRMEKKNNNISEIDSDEKILTVRKRYNNEFTKALSAEKTNNFFRLEKEFHSVVQKEMQERRLNRESNRHLGIKH